MKKIFIILFITSLSQMWGQTPDFAASYILREVHIYLADAYKKSVTKNQPAYLAYTTDLATTFVLPRSSSPLKLPAIDQKLQIQLSRTSCTKYISPLKVMRCQNKLNVLAAAATASNAILSAPSEYPINNALRIKLEMEAIAIQNLINEYLNK